MKKFYFILLITFFGKFLSTENLHAQTWSAVGTGLNSVGATGDVMCVYNGELYVGGAFTMAGNQSAFNIAKWNGTSWSAVGSGVSGIVYAMAVYNNELYV